METNKSNIFQILNVLFQIRHVEAKMPDFENRSGAYIWVREHRKRRKTVFAAQRGRISKRTFTCYNPAP